MEFQKILNFLDITSDNKDLPKFVTKKWIEVYDQSDENYNPNKEIRIKTSMLRTDLCDYSDAYIIVKENISVVKKIFTAAVFERLHNTSSGTDNNDIIHSILNSDSFDYKANFMENGVRKNNLTKNDVKIVVPLKHLRNFWRSLNIPLINCEIELILTWFKNCVLIDKLTRDANYNVNPRVSEINNPENPIFQITCTKLYVLVVTLSKENDIKPLEQLKSRFKLTIK